MCSLLLVKLETPADASSPEADYALGSLRVAAEQVWPAVEIHRLPVNDPVLPTGGDLLLVGSGNLLVTSRSLAAMAAHLHAGASMVVPFALADVLRTDEPPPYTLRGFERFEERFLAAPRPPASEARLLPLALLAQDLAATMPPAALHDGNVEAVASGRMVREGLYHHFADYHGQVREDVLPFIPSGARDVLEVGCGFGGTGRLLQERLGCRVTGVELNRAAAVVASRTLHRIVCGDIAEIDLDGSYDVVLGLELFEHLPGGEEVLLRLLERLRPGGRAVLSVPNVGHHAVALDLLAGRWDYLPIGLLCYTHYRFFTRRTLEDWLHRLGLRRFELVAQPTELPDLGRLAEAVELDRESLATKGFYVLIEA